MSRNEYGYEEHQQTYIAVRHGDERWLKGFSNVKRSRRSQSCKFDSEIADVWVESSKIGSGLYLSRPLNTMRDRHACLTPINGLFWIV